MTAFRTPVELIQLYWERVWNNREVELIREICADPIIRHDPQSVTPLSHDEQITRVMQQSSKMEPFFTHEVLHGDDTFVTSVWNMYTRKGGRVELSGIEVFKAENGRFTDCWNSSYTSGFWGRDTDIFNPALLPPPELLASVDLIDREWMQRVFAKAGVTVPRIAMVSRIEPIGHGTTCDTVRADFGYNADVGNAPQSVVCKFGPRSGTPAVSGANDWVQAFRREVEAYAFFGTSPEFRTPKSYYAEVDAAGSSINLVLEDLTKSTEPGDQIAGCSIGYAAAVVRELSILHRSYWNAPVLGELDWLLERRSFASQFSDIYAAGAAIFHDRFDGRLSKSAFEVIDKFAPIAAAWTAAPRKRRTFIHGDPRVDNILFGRSASNAIEAWLIDWQMASAGDPQFDLAYFLTGSLAPEDRRACERDLVAAHVAEISAVDPAYTIEEALEAYRFNIFAGLQTTVFAAVSVQPSPHNDELLMVLAERNGAAIRDWDGFAAIEAALSLRA